jgi:putative Holliday junction resolvase
VADRLLCIDFGLKFIGLAVADFPGITARALETIRADRQDPLQVIGRIVNEEQVTKILLGFPFCETEGEIHRRIREFGARLAKYFPQIPVELTDESYSSLEADEMIRETGIGRRRKQRSQDSQAAKIVLLRYLNATH